MVTTNENSHSKFYSLLERFTISKTGQPQDNEDEIHVSQNFVSVIDGATSDSTNTWDGKTGGMIAANVINKTFDDLPQNATARQAVNIITQAIHDYSKLHNVSDAIASFAAVSLFRKEIWLVGDCQCLIKGEKIAVEKKIDRLLSEVRSIYLEAELLSGKTFDDLRRHDTGNEYIVPLLEKQKLFQNKPSLGEYWYPAVDGSYVPDEGIVVHKIQAGTRHIVLASDGYPLLKEDLKQSELALSQILDGDPMLFRIYKAVKGMVNSNISFDDRTFLKIQLHW